MDPHANVKWGARLIPGYDGKIEIVAIVTGVKGASIMGKPLEETRVYPVLRHRGNRLVLIFIY